jgi:tRNA threonylcarbamoyladenosine biosynthesis protein TsaE
MTLHETLNDSEATLEAGARLARGLQAGMVLTLSGDLGAGKTTLVRGVLRGLGWTGPVKSPTYTLVEHYAVSSLYFYHFDFYRLADPDEWETSGFSDYFRSDSVCAIEWPDRVGAHLRVRDVEVALAHLERGRALELLAHTAAGAACLSAFAHRSG